MQQSLMLDLSIIVPTTRLGFLMLNHSGYEVNRTRYRWD